jgi:hypothetical protein
MSNASQATQTIKELETKNTNLENELKSQKTILDQLQGQLAAASTGATKAESITNQLKELKEQLDKCNAEKQQTQRELAIQKEAKSTYCTQFANLNEAIANMQAALSKAQGLAALCAAPNRNPSATAPDAATAGGRRKTTLGARRGGDGGTDTSYVHYGHRWVPGMLF